MKKFFLFMALVALSFTAMAQNVQEGEPQQKPMTLFGYFSLDKVMKSMAQYATVQADIAKLREQYVAETRHSEEEFNQKYELFLEGQRDFAPSILRKRQSELEDMLQKNVAFREEAKRLLTQAEAEALQPLKDRISEVLARIGGERGWLFIANTDEKALPYINPLVGVDINDLLITELNK